MIIIMILLAHKS